MGLSEKIFKPMTSKTGLSGAEGLGMIGAALRQVLGFKSGLGLKLRLGLDLSLGLD